MTADETRTELERRPEPLTVHVDEHAPSKSVRWRLTVGGDATAPTIYETHWISGDVYRVNEMRAQIELACDVYLGRRHFDPEREIRLLRYDHARLRDAARDVCWFDWSGNDPDATRAVDRLREVLDERMERRRQTDGPFVYLGRAQCGCVLGSVEDRPDYRAETAAAVADLIRDGLTVERVHADDERNRTDRCEHGEGKKETNDGTA